MERYRVEVTSCPKPSDIPGSVDSGLVNSGLPAARHLVLFVTEPYWVKVLITKSLLQRKAEVPEGGFYKFNPRSSNHVCNSGFRPGYQAITSAGFFVCLFVLKTPSEGSCRA